MRWESGRAKIAEGNLVRLWELAQIYDPVAEEIFANETRSYRRLIDANNLADINSREDCDHLVDLCKAKIDEAIEALQRRQQKQTIILLTSLKEELERWRQSSSQKQQSGQE